MPYMQPLEGFEPGPTTRKLLTYVCKKKKNIAGSEWPGLFEDTHFAALFGFTLIAVFLEGIGLIYIIDEIGLGPEAGFVAVAVLVLLDVALAFAAHWVKEGPVCVCENKRHALSLLTDGTPGAMAVAGAALDASKSRAKTFGFILAFLIWTLAGIKGFIYFSLVVAGGGGLNSEVVFIFATYIIVALIHVKCTGYTIYGLAARFAWGWGERKFVDSGPDSAPVDLRAIPRREDIVFDSNAHLIPNQLFQSGRHSLEKLIGVNLVQGCATLGGTAQQKFLAELTQQVQQEFMNRGISRMELANHAQAIAVEAQKRLEAALVVSVDKNTETGSLTVELKNFINQTYAVVPSVMEALSKGKSVYRLDCKGILLDNDLSILASHAPDKSGKDLIALHGLHLQISMTPD
jgi:hypothetical protein